jgi:UDPglucose 6-dehydrogenase
VIFIAVGTPPAESGEADLSYVEAVAREIGRALDGEKIIVEKSTVPVYTCEWVRRVVSMTSRNLYDFHVVSNPEFLREGTAVRDFLYPDRIVVGADDEKAAAALRAIYEPLTSGSYYKNTDAVPRPANAKTPAPLVMTSTKSAELIKHASNAFLAMKISFINAVANVCEAVGSDVNQVCEGMGLDSRIGKQFLRPGIGYGGSCFPKDVMAFRAVAREYGYDFRLLEEIMRINDDQRQRFLKKVRNTLWNVRGKRLAVLGLAFKGGTDDVRESPALDIVQQLVREGARVVAFDPAAMERTREVIGELNGLEYAKDAYAAAKDTDAVLILTDWADFAQLDLDRLREAMKHPILLDGRNLYKPEVAAEHGFLYVSVGRPSSEPADRFAAKTAANGRE